MNRCHLRLRSLESRLAPATFVVNSLGDAGAGSANAGDLRYCINEANASAGADVIDATGVTGMILLGSELPTITDELAVFGSGAAQLAVDGNLGSRLVQINGSGATLVSFQALEMRHGSSTANGGAVLVSNAKATFIDCRLNSNFANAGGALFGSASSSITVINCTLSGNNGFVGSGALYSAGALTVRNSTLSGNSTGPVGSGGAIGVGGSGTILVSNSTLSGNTAAVNGGAVRFVSSFSGTFQLKNCTVTQNQVTDASGTGRGVSRPGTGGTVQINSTVVAQNTGGAPATSDVAGAVSADFSLIGTNDAATITGTFNLTGTNAAPLDAKLAPLANNGGTTKTHMPMSDSPVLESGDNQDLLPLDQRGQGFIRTEGYTTDIGSVDAEYFLPLAARVDHVVSAASPATTYQFTVTYYDPRGSKLIDHSSLGTGDIYVTGPNGYYEIPTFISASPAADAETIVATYEIPVPVNSAAGWDISDNGNYPITVYPNEVYDKDTPAPNAGISAAFALIRIEVPVIYTVDEVSDVVDGKIGLGEVSLREAINLANADGQFSRIEFDPAAFAGSNTITLTGGVMTISENLIIDGPGADKLAISGNNASGLFLVDGAGTFSAAFDGLTLTQGKGFNGGAVVSTKAIRIEGCVISHNSASLGGAIATFGGHLTVIDSRISNNSAYSVGGIAAFGGATILRSTIADNAAQTIVAGIGVETSLFVEASTISGNVAQGTNGGGLQLQGAFAVPAIIRNSTISGNTAGSWGGGIVLVHTSSNVPLSGTLRVENSTVAQNTASLEGGGVWQHKGSLGLVEIVSTVFAGNTAGNGPDIRTDGKATLVDSLLQTTQGIATSVLTGTTASLLGQPAKLGPLADNGGPTKTHALLPGSPAINAGSNTVGLAFDQRGPGYVRTIGSGTDIGAFEVQSLAAPPTVSKVEVNGGAAQRSMVTTLAVTFSEAISFPDGLAAAFRLERTGPGLPTGSVNLGLVQSGNTVTVNFVTGGVVNIDKGGSLLDGVYQLTVVANKVQGAGGALDGDGNGTGGDDFVTPASGAGRLHRLFGDADGDADVDAVDFGAFRAAFGSSANLAFDSDGDGDVDAVDFGQFRARFGTSV